MSKREKKILEILSYRDSYGNGLKIIGIGPDWIDWERSDGLQYRVWDFEW